MPQRTPVITTRSSLLWLLILFVALAVVGLVAGWFIIYPRYERQQQVEQHYQAGVAFQNVGDWPQAATEYEQAIITDANHKDVQVRLAEVRSKLTEVRATATAVAVAQAESVRVDAQATTVAAQATEVAAPVATAEALEIQYQRGLGYMNIEHWENARAELKQVFEINPNYKEVQSKLLDVDMELAKLTPTAAPTPIATATPSHTPTPSVERLSTFNGTSTEGWTFYRGAMENPGTGCSGGGQDNGCLVSSKDVGGTTGYFIAPSKYYGDWSEYSALSFDIWSSGGDYVTSGYGMYGDIFLASGYATAQRLLSHRPPDRWTTFIIPLEDDGEWIFGGGATSIKDVLANVTDFQIRAEYGAGKDHSGLDNVGLLR